MPAQNKNAESKDWITPYMALACAQWGWAPAQFWAATPKEVFTILASLQKLHAAANPHAVTDEDYAHLKNLLEQHRT